MELHYEEGQRTVLEVLSFLMLLDYLELVEELQEFQGLEEPLAVRVVVLLLAEDSLTMTDFATSPIKKLSYSEKLTLKLTCSLLEKLGAFPMFVLLVCSNRSWTCRTCSGSSKLIAKVF